VRTIAPMAISTAPPVAQVDLTLSLGARTVDLATRALVVAVVPPPRWARDAEVVAGVRAAADAGADLVEVPPEPRLLGPAAAAGEVAVAARVDSAAVARAAGAAGAALLLVPVESETELAEAGADSGWQVARLVDDARAARDAVLDAPGRPVVLDVTRLAGADAVSEESLGLAVGARLVRTNDIRRTRRVVEVMAHLLEARR
jgi:hypothetical protein